MTEGNSKKPRPLLGIPQRFGGVFSNNQDRQRQMSPPQNSKETKNTLIHDQYFTEQGLFIIYTPENVFIKNCAITQFNIAVVYLFNSTQEHIRITR